MVFHHLKMSWNGRDPTVLPWDRSSKKKRAGGWTTTAVVVESPSEQGDTSDVEKKVLDLSHRVLEGHSKEKKQKIERLEKELSDARKSHIKLEEMKRRVANMIHKVGKQVEDEQKTDSEQLELVGRHVKEFRRHCKNMLSNTRPLARFYLHWTPNTFDISKMMNEWYTQFTSRDFKRSDVFPYLFGEEGGDMRGCSLPNVNPVIAATWKVVPHVEDAQMDRYYRREGCGDDDGPAKSFFCCLWNQLGSLHIDGVQLFSMTLGGLVPVDPDFFVNKKSQAWYESNLDRIHRYYRAIGRILAHCLLLEIPIVNFVLPKLYVSKIIRGVDVTEKHYDFADLVEDTMLLLDLVGNRTASDINLLLARLDLQESEEDEVLVRGKIHQIFFEGKGNAISSLAEGIALDETLPLRLSFGLAPTITIFKVLFAPRQVVTYDMVFDSKGEFRFFHFAQDNWDHEKSESYHEEQALFLAGFVDWIKEKLETDPRFIGSFFQLVTGMSYLPNVMYDKDFRVTVEYNATEMGKNLDFLPVVHTCVNTIKIPANAYNGNIAIFEERLRQTMLYAGDGFDMT